MESGICKSCGVLHKTYLSSQQEVLLKCIERGNGGRFPLRFFFWISGFDGWSQRPEVSAR